jgi:uncharacterized protein (TIGR02722 family)
MNKKSKFLHSARFVVLSSISCGFLLGSLVGCTSPRGTYTDPKEVTVLGDKWSNTDANKVADYMVKKCLEASWLTDFMASHQGKKPVVIVADVENRTDEHIDTNTLSEAIRSELINSRKVRFLNNEQRKKIEAELKYQNSGAVAAGSRKSTGKAIGADFMLNGAISSIVSKQGDEKTVTYRVDMNVTNLETQEIEWNGFQSVKKYFER